MLYRILLAPEGGYTVQVAHRCRIVPPCLQLSVWGPFEDLELAEQTRRLVWPSARPGQEEDFTIPHMP